MCDSIPYKIAYFTFVSISASRLGTFNINDGTNIQDAHARDVHHCYIAVCKIVNGQCTTNVNTLTESP